MAASLNRVHAELSIPKAVADNRIVELASEAVKVFYLPYLTQRSIERSSYGQEEAMKLKLELMEEAKLFLLWFLEMEKRLKLRTLDLDMELEDFFLSVPDTPLSPEFFKSLLTIMLPPLVLLRVERLKLLMDMNMDIP